VCSGVIPRNVANTHYQIDVNVLATHKQSYYIQIFEAPYLQRHFYYNPCFCNEFRSLIERHLPLPIQGYEPEVHRRLLRPSYDKILALKTEDLGKVSHSVLLAHTRAKIYSRYKNAYVNLLRRRSYLSNNDGFLKMFIKVEKMAESEGEPYSKAPRAIQHRSYEYLYVLKKRQLAFSLWAKTVDSLWNHQPFNTVFTKTYNNPELAVMLKKYWDEFDSPVAYCLDHSYYDGRKERVSLEEEHRLWLGMFGNTAQHRYVLRMQLANRAFSKGGIRYKYSARRASGEWTTSDGNCADNAAMLDAWCTHSGFSRFFIFVNGDDSIVMLDSSEEHKALPMSFFSRMNQITKLDKRAYDFREIEYCQCSPCRIRGRWQFVRKPFRVMSRCSYTTYEYLRVLDRYLAGVGLCELAVNVGVPMLQAWSVFLILQSHFNKPLGCVDKIPARLSMNTITIADVTPEARADFAVAFGIQPYEQLRFERAVVGEAHSPLLYQFLNKYKNFHNE